jgi:hypothetical protein
VGEDRSLTEWTVDELRDLCKRGKARVQKYGSRVRTTAAIVVGVAVVAMAPRYGLFLALTLGLLVYFAVAFVTRRLPAWLEGRLSDTMDEHRYKLARAELTQRLMHPFAAAEIRMTLATEGGPDWALDVECSFLPHGGHRRVLARVFAPRLREPSRVVVGCLSSRTPLDDIEEATYDTVTWDTSRAERMVALLREASTLPPLGSVDSRVIDGAPCRAKLFTRDASGESEWSANIAGVPKELEGHPAVRVLREAVQA